MAEEKIDLAFDTNPFENAMNTIIKGVVRMTNAMEGANQKTQKSNMKSNMNMKKGFSNAVAFGIAKFQILKSFLKRIFLEMPEMMQVFKIGGDIIMKNLFWPLRRMLIPMLQRVLNWVRENRVMFVKMGTVIANVFRTAMGIAKSFFNLLQTFFKGFEESIGRVFNFNNIIEGLNVAMFKIALLFAFLEIKLRPFTKILGKIFGEIVKMIKEFTKGFIEGFMGIDEKIKILETLEKTFDGIYNLITKLTPLMKPLGKLFGELIGENIATTLAMVDSLIEGINYVIDLFSGKMSRVALREEGLKKWFSKKENLENLLKTSTDIMTLGATKVPKTILEKTLFKEKAEKKVKDAIIKPNGQIIRTDPLDTIIAMKKPEKLNSVNKLIKSEEINTTTKEIIKKTTKEKTNYLSTIFEKKNGEKNINKKIDFGEININVNVTEGNAKESGINFGEGLKETIRTFFLEEALG